MDFGYDNKLNEERLERVVRDGETARMMGWWHRPAQRAVRDAGRIGSVVRRGLSATARCRWELVDEAVNRLETIELRPAASLAMRAISAQARGDEQEAGELCDELQRAPVATNADPHVWASGVIAAALHGYLTGTVDDSAQPVALVEQMCSRFDHLHPETTHFMCLSLALLARAGESPVLASFLLGHVAQTVGGLPAPDTVRGGAIAGSKANAALRAVTGLCIITMGDSRSGARLLVDLMDGREASSMPLVTGLVGAEMARLELMEGNRQAAARWVDRSRRFSDRYGSRLPLQVVTRAREQIPTS